MTAGTLCQLQLKNIVPTQISVGRHAAVCKARRLKERNADNFKKGLTRYLLRAKRQVPVVIGPKNTAGNRFYITDHHHLSYAMYIAREKRYIDNKYDSVYACILTNRAEDKTENFWNFMVNNHFTWLADTKGEAITTTELRKKATELSKLDNHPYRTWSRWVRDSCGYIKAGNDCVPAAYSAATAPFFMEFKWADYLEQNLKNFLADEGITGIDVGKIDDLSDQDIDKVLEEAIKLAQGDQAFLQDLPGFSNGTVLPVQNVDIDHGCAKD